jgi:choloylglycine hydrolase
MRLDIKLTPFDQAAGTSLLPGGYPSPERFVRTAYLKTHVPAPKNAMDAVISCFHIMESVTIPRGTIFRSEQQAYMKSPLIPTNTSRRFGKADVI